jgi:hypothetical protein
VQEDFEPEGGWTTLTQEQYDELSDEGKAAYGSFQSQFQNAQEKAKEKARREFEEQHAKDLEAARVWQSVVDPETGTLTDIGRKALIAADDDLAEAWQARQRRQREAESKKSEPSTPEYSEDDLIEMIQNDPVKYHTVVQQQVQSQVKSALQPFKEERSREAQAREEAQRLEWLQRQVNEWKQVEAKYPFASTYRTDPAKRQQLVEYVEAKGLTPHEAFVLLYTKEKLSKKGSLREAVSGTPASPPPAVASVPANQTQADNKGAEKVPEGLSSYEYLQKLAASGDEDVAKDWNRLGD